MYNHIYTTRTLDITTKWQHVKLNVGRILYVIMQKQDAEIHLYGGKIYTTRITCGELKEQLGEDFLEIRRGCLVSAITIQNITETVNLINGEALKYTIRRKKEIIHAFRQKQQAIIGRLAANDTPKTYEAYRQHYCCYEDAPFAFADIKMIFNDEISAVDWIFCYGNEALAKLEMFPLKKLIGQKFSVLFENMDSDWLRFYEKAVLYGEIMEINHYSPEIDAFLKVICFPTFWGHCVCILFHTYDLNVYGDDEPFR